MDDEDKQLEQERNQANNEEIAKTAAKAAATYYGGAVGNKIANAATDENTALGRAVNKNIIKPVGNAVSRQARRVPGGQQLLNKAVESGATDKINQAVNASAGDMGPNKAGANASQAGGTQPKAGTEKPSTSSDSSGGGSKPPDGPKKEKATGTGKMSMPKGPIGIIAVAIIAVLLVLAVLLSVLSEGGGEITTAEMNKQVREKQEEAGYELDNKEEDYESNYSEKDEAFNGFWGTETEEVTAGQLLFYARYKQIYKNFRFWHPTLNNNQITATKFHLLTTLFLDYTPEGYSDDILGHSASSNPEETEDHYSELSAYKICEEGCEVTDESYKLQQFLSYILEFVEDIQKYLRDADSLRKLLRNFVAYVGHCEIYQTCEKGTANCNCNSSGNHCKKKVEEWYTPEYSLLEMLKNWKELLKDYKKCLDKADSLDGGSCEYNLEEHISFCAYYESLMEYDGLGRNYLEDHNHFKYEFQKLRREIEDDAKYEEASKKLKQLIIRDIIDTVYETDESAPIYEGQYTNDDYTNYTLSQNMYVTVNPDKEGENGGAYTLDQYVEGVIMDEVGVFYHYRDDFDYSDAELLEMWKAMAIAIRSYTLQRTNGGTKTIRNSSADQNFTSAYLNSQTAQATLARRAVRETSGQVLLVNGKYFSAEYDAFYKKTSGGDNSVGGFNCENGFCSVTYLKKGSNSSKTYHTVSVPESWRNKLAGGHGRGLSQYGALYMASQGSSYNSILDFFYADEVKLSKMTLDEQEIEVEGQNNTTTGTTSAAPSTAPLASSYTSSGGRKIITSNIYNEEAAYLCEYDIEVPLRLTGVSVDPNIYQTIDGELADITVDIPEPNATQKELGQSIADKALSIYQNNKQDFCYVSPGDDDSARIAAYNNQKVNGYLYTDCNAFVGYVAHHAINVGPTTGTGISNTTIAGHSSNGSWYVRSTYEDDFEVVATGLSLDQALASAQPGDLLGSGSAVGNEWHIQVYIGDGKIIDNANASASDACGSDLAIRSKTGAGADRQIRHQGASYTIIRVKG